MPYPLTTPLGRFGIETSEESRDRCVASIPVRGLRNPLTGEPTVAPLAMLVDHIGGLINHARRGGEQWTVSSELSLEVAPDAAEVIASSRDGVVVGTSRPLGAQGTVALGICELAVAGHIVATATVRSFYIRVPGSLAPWPDRPAGSLPGSELHQLMAVGVGEAGGDAAVLVQHDDPVLNNSVGAVHGGVSSMGLELVGSAAVNRHRDPAVNRYSDPAVNRHSDPPSYRTASLRVNFLRPFHGGGEAHYRAAHSHLGRSSAVAEAEAVGRDGRVALVARLTAYR